MYKKELIGLGFQIGTIRKAIRIIGMEVDELIRGIADEKLRMVPEGGWPGKNADEREISEHRAYTENRELGVLEGMKLEVLGKVAVLGGDLELLEAERRGYEFAVRDALAYALGGYNEEEADKVQDMAVDGAAAIGVENISDKAVIPQVALAPTIDISSLLGQLSPEVMVTPDEAADGSADDISSMLKEMGVQ